MSLERLRIAVLTSHAAQVHPDNPLFAPFFALLDTLGERRPFSELAECDALLVGGPLEPFDDETIALIRAAVDRGAHLLILAHAGGDDLPLGRAGAKSNLSRLCDHFVFEQTVLHTMSTMWGVENTEITVKARGVELDVSAACTIAISPHAEVLTTYCVDTTHIMIGRAHERDKDFPDVITGLVQPAESACVLVRVKQGEGTITAFSGAMSLRHEGKAAAAPSPLARLLVAEWLAEKELLRRMQRTQRHRLLHGYPMHPLSAPTEAYDDVWAGAYRSLIVGVLPHAFCNPTTKGCGFCAFPHDQLNQQQMDAVVKKVIADVAEYPNAQRKATALYFGGATANLTPLPLHDELCAVLAEKFVPGEVTLEGVPKYFQIQQYRALEITSAHFAGPKRISMGIQTFDDAQLRAMGRAGFGDRTTFAQVTEAAHRSGYAVSGDFLINLPGQTRDAVLRDVDEAITLGLDQICLYHLVLAPQLDVPWAKDPQRLAALPSNRDACDTWLAARDRLLERGFMQRTLTNFVRAGSPSFLYEEQGFIVEQNDTLGFGPASITRAANASFRAGSKIERPTAAADFLAGKHFRRFAYGERDMQILFVTRGLARLFVDAPTFRELFGAQLHEVFGVEIERAVAAKLVEVHDHGSLTLTPRGMFYSDSFAGLIAWERVGELRMPRVEAAKTRWPGSEDEGWRRFKDANDSMYGGMG